MRGNYVISTSKITMKANLRRIAKKILKLYPNLEVSELTELIKDQCIHEHSTYTHDLAEWAADREVNKQDYSRIYQERKSRKHWG
jgi:hypothetical protein